MFFSTQKDYGMYSILTKSTLLHYNKKFKTKSKINYFSKKFFSIKFFLFYIFQILNLLIFRNREKFLFLKYKNCDIGRHVTASVYRDASSYKSKLHLYRNYLRYFLLGGLVVESAIYYSNKSKAIYIDHTGYINGLFFSVFAEKKKIIYTNCYPRGLFFIDFKKRNNFKKRNLEICLKLEKKESISKIKKNYVKKLIFRPSLIPHIRKQKWHTSKIQNLRKVDYVIYTHSFVDGQLWWGLDGFVNLRDWTEFTIETLIKKKANILVKIHPNFFQKIKHDFIKLDIKIFYELMKKYDYYKDITFIDFPIKNEAILNGIRKDTIIVSHHGTALLEGIARNFKCISSVATLWSKEFKLTNSWNSPKNYKKLLNKKWKDLKFANQNDFLKLETQLFGNKFSLYGKNWWQKNIAKIFQIHLHNLIANPHEISNKISHKKFYKTVKKVSECIEEVNL